MTDIEKLDAIEEQYKATYNEKEEYKRLLIDLNREYDKLSDQYQALFNEFEEYKINNT